MIVQFQPYYQKLNHQKGHFYSQLHNLICVSHHSLFYQWQKHQRSRDRIGQIKF